MKDKTAVKELLGAHKMLSLRFLKVQMLLEEMRQKGSISSYKIEKKVDSYCGKFYTIAIYFYIEQECRLNISRYFLCAEKKGKNAATCSFAVSKDIEEDVHRVFKFFGYEK